ncbi:hypothetical protein B0H19DRAFT_967484, partial [Mycena capillaripes]
DEAWDNLQADKMLRLPRNEAVLLPNKTTPIPGDPGYYVAELEVHHNLHCLNQIRKALNPTYYPNWGVHRFSTREFHIAHCVERIRQALMCHADTSVLVWQWNPSLNETRVKLRIPHQCKDFSKIQEWTRENLLETPFDRYTHVPDDLPTPRPIY